jgi:predicted phage tail protein
MLINGVTELLTPQVNPTGPTGMSSIDPAALSSNYSFTGLTNVANAGVPVNLVYGEILTGSIVVSNGVTTVQIEGTN